MKGEFIELMITDEMAFFEEYIKTHEYPEFHKKLFKTIKAQPDAIIICPRKHCKTEVKNIFKNQMGGKW